MTPQQIMDGMKDKNRMLSQKNDEYQKLLEVKAQAEMNYNQAYAQKITELRINGEPTTIIKELAKGDVSVSKLMHEYAIAIGVEKACLESIKDIRTAIDSYRSLLTWLRAELTIGTPEP